MLKIFAIIFLCTTDISFGAYLPHHVQVISKSNDSDEWSGHIMDFLELLDVEAIASIIVDHLQDDEVLTFISYILSPEFRQLIMEFESMKEFKEATEYLTSKGYDINAIINFINLIFELPPYGRVGVESATVRGMEGMITAIMDTLPVKEMKELLDYKIKNHKEVAEFFATISSDEFQNILKRMRSNPTYQKAKRIFEGLGINFNLICGTVTEILGEYSLGIFC